MKCYYELLEISREADENEIKTAYRKLALKWHPDKNIDNPEGAKEQFQLVQQAYEVLSDRQERAWYDNHREQILRGSNSDFKDDSVDVFPYFTTQCFKGYGDDEQSFYSIYRTLFEKIATEDIEFMDSKSDFDEIPNFGNSMSGYDEFVGHFYGYWSSYTTKKSYTWLDPISINEARNSRVLKIIEKENKKVRQKAKKERNEEIRNLVAFVRKRDKRVQAHSKYLEAKVVENRIKQEQLRKQKILENKKELNNHKSQAEWSKFDNVKRELKQIEKNLAEQFGEYLSDSDLSNSADEDLNNSNNSYCIACNKVFKTPKAFSNHESSKKHRENIEKLKLIMLEEDEIEKSTISDEEEIKIEKIMENVETDANDLEDIEEEHSDLDEETINATKNKNKKSKKVIRLEKISVTEDSSELSESEPILKLSSKEHVSDEDFNFGSVKKQKKKNNKQKTKNTSQENSTLKQNNSEKHDSENEEAINSKKQRPKRSHKNVAVSNSSGSIDIDITHCCVACKSNFSSKNKLFDHLKKTGHSVILPDKLPKNRKKLTK